MRGEWRSGDDELEEKLEGGCIASFLSYGKAL